MADNLDYDSGCTGVDWVNSTEVGRRDYYEGLLERFGLEVFI